jgi:hypothetical protein
MHKNRGVGERRPHHQIFGRHAGCGQSVQAVAAQMRARTSSASRQQKPLIFNLAL